MATTYYDTLDGEIFGLSTGGTRTDFLTDALGSITATVDATATVTNTYRHKPYGQQLAKTGAGIDPKFLWTGNTGSRTTGLSGAEQYNRARHYANNHDNWTTVDPLWPDELAYAYVSGNPTTWIDPSGRQEIVLPGLRPFPIFPSPFPGTIGPGLGPALGGTFDPIVGPVPLSCPRTGFWDFQLRFSIERYKDAYQKACEELYDWYKDDAYACGDKRGGIDTTPGGCTPNQNEVVLAERLSRNCSCCYGRSKHYIYCFRDKGHWTAMKSACTKCLRCIELWHEKKGKGTLPPIKKPPMNFPIPPWLGPGDLMA